MRVLLVALLLFFYSFGVAHADNEFITSSSTTYDIDVSGKTTVTHQITLENVFTDLYATEYALSLNQPEISEIKAFDKTGNLKTDISQESEKTQIKLKFNDIVVGKGEKRQFSISYIDPNIATHAGQIWEIIIPGRKSTDASKQVQVTLKVPTGFGEIAYMSPDPSDKDSSGGKNTYNFNGKLAESPITAAFGKFQVFSFDLTYHLENPLNKSAFTEIALPPDTEYQKINLEKLEPKPDQVSVDSDGNWIAKYILDPRERFDVKADGFAQMFSQPLRAMYPDKETLKNSLKPTPVWQSDDPKIQELAKQLKTPKAIYDYVASTLSYDYDRVKPNATRLGAIEALNNPTMAICMEFTDLFVAIARAAGIPAREINGYAYTENPQLQPLSLVADVLHSWPQYWDEGKQMWVQIDPTWGSTSGVDFFNKLDLRHLTFVIHGNDSYEPFPPGSYKLGPNPQKDVFVNFSQVPENLAKSKLDIAIDNFNVKATNTGPQIITNAKVEVYFDDKLAQTFESTTLPPFGHLNFSIDVPSGFLGKDMPQNVILVAGDQEITIPTNKQSVIIGQTATILAIILLLLAGFLIFVRRRQIIKFIKSNAKIPNLRNKLKRSS